MDMLPTVVSAIVSALLAAYSAYSATKRAAEDRERAAEARRNERDIEFKSELAAIGAKVDLLSERVEKHNNLIERMYKIEADVSNLHELIKVGGTE